MSDGRLDEAFALATVEDVRRHRRGQDLIGRLTKALLARCREHLSADRLSQALADSDKAARLGGSTPAVAGAKADVAAAMSARRQAAGKHLADQQAVGDHLADGRITLAEAMVDEGDSDDLKRQVDRRRDETNDAARRVQAALDRGDWAGGVDQLLTCRRRNLAGGALTSLTAHVTDLVSQQVRSAITAGRLDRAGILLTPLSELSPDRPEVAELLNLQSQIGQARSAIEAGRPRQGAEILRRLAPLLPEATWLSAAAGHCDLAAEAGEALRSGPMGLLNVAADETPPAIAPASPVKAPSAARTCGPASTPSGDSDRLLLRVDGVGGYLLVRDDRVTVGPVSSPARPTVGLMADPAAPVATIERAEGDYFLRADRPVKVNEQTTSDTLLLGGERIALSDRCRFKFAKPNAASTSAILDLSGSTTRLPQADVTSVILVDRELVIGPALSAHVHSADVGEPIVFHFRDNRLQCAASATIMETGKSIPAKSPLPLDTPLQIASIRVTITAP